MKVNRRPSFPRDCNPFEHDTFRMGTDIGRNITIMYAAHKAEYCEYIIIVDKTTGERISVDFNKEVVK